MNDAASTATLTGGISTWLDINLGQISPQVSPSPSFLHGPANANARRPRAQPWSVPRLRGRGEQGDIMMHT